MTQSQEEYRVGIKLSRQRRQVDNRLSDRPRFIEGRAKPGGMQGEGGAMALYEIRLKGHLDQRWSTWFDGMTLTHDANGETILSGLVVDQATSHSPLIKVHTLNSTLISVVRIEADAPAEGEE